MTMGSKLFTRGLKVGLAMALLASFSAPAADARPEPEKGRRRQGFNLKAATNVLMNVNRVQCNVNNLGEVCVDPFNSPVLGGGFWPKGTPDQYIFNSGLQLAGVIPSDAGFEWAGDTVGAFFMDARGDQRQGDGVTQTFSSLDPADAAAWPQGGVVRDADIYNDILLGRNFISQQDLWVRTWDGNASLLSGRDHPMGILVDERGVAWNFPSGNEDIIYFIYTFYNVTASDPSAYANIDPAIRDEVAASGMEFRDEASSKLGVSVPSGGYRIEDLYAAFYMDPDVGSAGANYSTAILPFDMAVAYKSDFLEPNWSFPPDIFGAPFAPNPGFVGVKYLRSPLDPATGQEVGLTMFSNTRNAATGFPDPIGVIQLFRYLSGNASPAAGDNPCTFPNAKARRLCFLDQVSADTRFFQSSGPFALNPGESATIVVAYIHAAPVAAPLIASGEIGGDLQPQIPFPGDSIAIDPSKVRVFEEIAGWAGQTDLDSSGVITQDEVITVPRSLLDKALVAQAVFDNKFLLPFAPEPPDFFLVPGENQVTIVWQPSPSEAAGDPFAAIASDPTSPLFDPNFREFDVEGYRIYRGRGTDRLVPIAQFDYAGTTFIDFTGGFDYGNQCAPELGVTGGCPGFPNTLDITGQLVQVPPGGRVELSDGSIFLVVADTLPALSNTGVPFAFIDANVRNSFNYFYAVTAFDVNSAKSGPSSLESPRITKSISPRAPSPNEVQAQLSLGMFGDDGVELDPTAVWSIDPASGRFIGTPPPTNSIEGVFAPLVSQLLPGVTLTATIDSIRYRNSQEFPCGGFDNFFGDGGCDEFFVTFDDGTTSQQFRTLALHSVWSAFSGPNVTFPGLGEFSVDADPASAQRFGIPAGFSKFNASVQATLREAIQMSSWAGQWARRFGSNIYPGGSRWFEGEDETVDHPTYGVRVGTGLTGVDSVWTPFNHTDTDPDTPGAQTYSTSGAMQCYGYVGAAGMMRQADIRVTWGGGTLSEVRDLTHHVNVRFHPHVNPTWGFVGDNDGDGVIDWRDFNYLEAVSRPLARDGNSFCGHVGLDPGLGNRPEMSQTPIILPVDMGAIGDGSAVTGTGFGLYINGERFIFALTGGSLPSDGTQWTLRTHAGPVQAASGAETRTPSGYTFTPFERPPMVEGLQIVFNVSQATQAETLTQDMLDEVHTVPDPYYVTNELEQTPFTKVMKFVNLPPRAIVRIYSLSGVLVQVLEHNDPGLGGELNWNVRNRNNQFIASGVYFFHVETPEGLEKIGRFTVVNFAQ